MTRKIINISLSVEHDKNGNLIALYSAYDNDNTINKPIHSEEIEQHENALRDSMKHYGECFLMNFNQ